MPQLDTVIIEVSSVKGLSMRGNPLWLYRAKHLPLKNLTYGDTGFYSGQTSYLNVKVLVIAKNENMRFFLNHCQPELWSKMLTLQWPHQTSFWHAALERCIVTKVGTLLTS